MVSWCGCFRADGRLSQCQGMCKKMLQRVIWMQCFMQWKTLHRGCAGWRRAKREARGQCWVGDDQLSEINGTAFQRGPRQLHPLSIATKYFVAQRFDWNAGLGWLESTSTSEFSSSGWCCPGVSCLIAELLISVDTYHCFDECNILKPGSKHAFSKCLCNPLLVLHSVDDLDFPGVFSWCIEAAFLYGFVLQAFLFWGLEAMWDIRHFCYFNN